MIVLAIEYVHAKKQYEAVIYPAGNIVSDPQLDVLLGRLEKLAKKGMIHDNAY